MILPGQPICDIQRNASFLSRAFHDIEAGVALFMVLWVLTMLSIIVGEFCYAMRTEVNITRNLKEKTQAYYIALAGANLGIAELVNHRGVFSITEADDIEETKTIPWRLNADIPVIPFENGEYKIKIDNESGKIDLNLVDKPLLKAVLRHSDLTDAQVNGIADAILDWRDKDRLHRLNGAEDDYYMNLPEPYQCKDGDFESTEELLLVKGITSDVYHEVLRHVFTVNRMTDEDLADLPIEISSQKESERRKINVNAASREVLLALPGMTPKVVEKILEYRKEKDFVSTAALIKVMGTRSFMRVKHHIHLKNSKYFTFQVVGRVNGSHAEHYLKVMVRLDIHSRQKYKIIKWWDQASAYPNQ